MKNEHVFSPAASPWSLDSETCRDRLEPAIQREVIRDTRKKDTSAAEGGDAVN